MNHTKLILGKLAAPQQIARRRDAPIGAAGAHVDLD